MPKSVLPISIFALLLTALVFSKPTFSKQESFHASKFLLETTLLNFCENGCTIQQHNAEKILQHLEPSTSPTELNYICKLSKDSVDDQFHLSQARSSIQLTIKSHRAKIPQIIDVLQSQYPDSSVSYMKKGGKQLAFIRIPKSHSLN